MKRFDFIRRSINEYEGLSTQLSVEKRLAICGHYYLSTLTIFYHHETLLRSLVFVSLLTLKDAQVESVLDDHPVDFRHQGVRHFFSEWL